MAEPTDADWKRRIWRKPFRLFAGLGATGGFLFWVLMSLIWVKGIGFSRASSSNGLRFLALTFVVYMAGWVIVFGGLMWTCFKLFARFPDDSSKRS